MRPSRKVLLVWSVMIVILVALEFLELTRFFTFPISYILGDPALLVFSLVFLTVVAMIGAIFVGIYISERLLSPRGFTPFEEEMLKMSAELREVRATVEELRARLPPSPPGPPGEEVRRR